MLPETVFKGRLETGFKASAWERRVWRSGWRAPWVTAAAAAPPPEPAPSASRALTQGHSGGGRASAQSAVPEIPSQTRELAKTETRHHPSIVRTVHGRVELIFRGNACFLVEGLGCARLASKGEGVPVQRA